MGESTIILLVLGGIAFIGIIWFVATYNGLAGMRLKVKNTWSQIDVQLKRRYDLIPNLVNTVKGYAKHEKELFEKIAEARSRAMSAKGVAEQGQAEAALTSALRGIMVLVENYPELKANENFKALQEELTSTENKISFARQLYNDTVERYNTMIATIPSSIIAGMCGFQPAEFFKVESEEERRNVKVEF